MRPIEVASTRWVMQQCPFQPRLSAFYDRELDPLTAREFQSHLSNCPQCSAELDSMQTVSRLMQEAPVGRLSQIGRARLHQTADQASRRRDGFPLARALMTIAASVLIIAGAWLVEMPKGGGATVAKTSQPQADWEYVAGGGKLYFLHSETGLADRRFQSWMLEGLKVNPDHEN